MPRHRSSVHAGPHSPALEAAGARIAPPTETALGDPGIGAQVQQLDVRKIGPEAAAELRALVYAHKLIVLRDQDVSDPEYIAFARALGEPQIYFQPNYHHPRHPEIFVSSNVEMDGRKVGVAGTGGYWHSDYQFFPEPLPLTMITPKAVPSGSRGTHYIDMAAVLRRMPDELRARIGALRGVHEAKWRYKIQARDIDKSITQILEEFGAETPTVTHPLVMRHPVTGEDLLYISRGFTVGVEGLSIEEGRALLDELFEYVERDEHVYVHPWGMGDILLWDNRQLIHMASGGAPGEPSTSYRIGVYDGLPFCANEPRGRLAR